MTSTPKPDDILKADGVTFDLGREVRCGFPEAIYAPGKSPAILCKLFQGLQSHQQNALATRVDADQVQAVMEQFPSAIHHQQARTIRLMSSTEQKTDINILVVTAGTTDAPVAVEAMETLHWMQFSPTQIDDIGVAGPQRILNHVDQLQQADVIIVVAGMEGALPSVVAGWVSCPVIAVPTSVGYGANLGGITALLGMLNSCAANVCVVNIDAGFKAGYLAGLMAARMNHQEQG